MDENCHVEPVQKVVTSEEQSHVETVRLGVWGMGCPNCANRVRNSLLSVKGVVYADVDHVAGAARVAYNPDMISADVLLQAVARAGNDGHHEYGASILPSV